MSLVFKVDQIDEQGIEFSDTLDASLLADMGELLGVSELEQLEPIAVSGRIEKAGQDLRLKGRVRLKAKTICSRCGENAVWSLDSGFEMVLMPRKEHVVEVEHQISPEEFSRTYYEGPEIDLGEHFREQIDLERPMQIICRPDCKGLCPGCGLNLNTEVCTCPKEEGDPRLAVLRRLKIDK